MRDSLEALVGGDAALWRQRGRGLIRACGSDRVRFLNGMVSNQIEGLAPERAVYACQLDRKGHLLGDLWVIVLEDEVLLDIAPGRVETVFALLQKHVIADQVVLENRSSGWSAVSFEGAGAAASVGRAPLAPGAAAREGEAVWLGGGALSEQGIRLLGPEEAIEAAVLRSGLEELRPAQLEVLRIEHFVPAWGAELDERTFPAEARLDGSAVSFTKGCYIGQEIAARIHARGAVNRLLVMLAAEREMEPGAEISLDGRKLGTVTSAARSPLHGPLALGFVRSAHAEPGTALQVAGVPARVAGPPFPE